MKKADIYEIAVKLMGIYLITHIIYSLRGIFELLFYNSTAQFGSAVLLSSIFSLVLFCLVSFYLIFRTKIIVDLITRGNEREEEVKLFTGKKNLYEIALVLIGGLTFIWSFPDICYGIYNYFHWVNQGLTPAPNQLPSLAIEIVKALFGILIIIGADLLSTFFSKE